MKTAVICIAFVAVGACARQDNALAPPATGTAAAPSSSAATSASTTSTSPPAPASASASSSGAPAPVTLVATPFPLPGATGAASLDYIAYEAPGRVWIPVGSTGSADAFDVTARTFTRVDGFKTAVRDARGTKRTVGPSSAAAGDGVVYIGNRATNEVCPIDAKKLALGKCLALPVAIDGLAYVASAKELWVTEPHESQIAVLDASKPGALAPKAIVKLEGAPEGYAVDDAHGIFYTNLEDKGGTVAIDVKTHKPTSTWNAGCGSDGPRGLVVDGARGLVVVACTDHLQVLDASPAHGGAKLGTLDTGAGVDNVDYAPSTKLVYAAAGKAERLTIASLDDKGVLTVVATGATAPGARNPVVDGGGRVYVADSQASRIWVFDAPPSTH
jgi:hypothetical protein